MNRAQSEIVRKTLERPEIHARWIGDYYTDDSNPLYEAVFDRICDRLAAREKTRFLDAGCGDGAHSVRLAKRGYPVLALDFSEHILRKARENAAANRVEQSVTFEHGSLLRLPIEDCSFDFVLCWGVLMHIPDVETAIAELARVVRPNGLLLISENNMWSLESILVRNVRRLLGRALLKRLRGKEPATLRIAPAGAEYWRQTDVGPLICREARISWLIATLARHGFIAKERMATEFTELHTVVRAKRVKRWLCKLNLLWFRYIQLPHPAMDNLLLFQKTNK